MPDESSANITSKIPINRYIIFLTLAIFGAALDLLTKQYMFDWLGTPSFGKEPYWLIDGYVGFETSVNRGALFGLGTGYSSVFAGLSVVAAVGICCWLFFFGAAMSRWLTWAMGFVVAGVLGNLYDRLGLAADPNLPPDYATGVRDWILLRYQDYTWPNFNIADSFLVTGAIMLAWFSFFAPELNAPENKNDDA